MELVKRCNLVDVNLVGRKFTWYRTNGSCKSRLDRALVNDKWLERWPDSYLRGLPRSISDHCAIVLYSKHMEWGPKPFRFVNAWLSHPEFLGIVEKSWISGWGCYVFKEKLKRLKEELKKWNVQSFGSLDLSIANLRNEIHTLDTIDDILGLSAEEVCRRNEASACLMRQLCNRKSLFAQKAKMRWLKEGDVNSSFFHKSIKLRRRNNALSGLEWEENWVEDPIILKELVKDHFSKHFQKQRNAKMRLAHDFEVQRLGEEESDVLIRPFLEEEIKKVVWDCEGMKSPGPDGFNFEFYRACWSIIRRDLMRVVNEFHENGRLMRGCNTSFIVMIPKKEGACGLNQFRPISLIGSLYKLIAKALAYRLKPVMDKLIGDSQTAFLKGRYILDGVVVLNEAVEEARKSKKERLLFKVDFAKAYDTLDWNYLLDLMARMNFPTKWIRWMEGCVTTASANVLVNGSPSGEFVLGRGIRQGDPLSPFLFLIAAEGLNLIINRAVREGLMGAIHIGIDKIQISHLQYADDTVFIVDGTRENALVIK